MILTDDAAQLLKRMGAPAGEGGIGAGDDGGAAGDSGAGVGTAPLFSLEGAPDQL